MYFLEKTTEFDKWLRKLNDLKAKAKILFRLQKLEKDEHFGDCEAVGEGIRELKLTMQKATESISKKWMAKLSFCLLEETNQVNKETLKKQKRFGEN
ncbi:type II toxin-antitoxin system RelE/ParE family toxin [Flavobacterium polysaccharolyticum]|uniref:Type II toxin-antitoxin system RelE/ParE family toxin n=1 Tax=Flavobacterium polysaccharolyticum TaxID=3133148 RepID=A0ABU9NPQ3_9FLAO